MKSLSRNFKQKHLNCKVQKGKFVSKNARSTRPTRLENLKGPGLSGGHNREIS